MFRTVFYLLLAIVLIALLRSVISAVRRTLAAFSQAGRPSSSGPRMVGELKRDPVCGTYVSTATSVKRIVDGQTFHFCSPECSRKYGQVE
jgi:YHS domain-containing protein